MKSEPEIAIALGKVNPVMNDESITAPVLALISTTVPEPAVESAPLFDTKRVDPDNAIPLGLVKPETNEALIAAPVLELYSPIVPLP